MNCEIEFAHPRERSARLVGVLNQLSERCIRVVALTHRPYEFAGLVGQEVQFKDTIEEVA